MKHSAYSPPPAPTGRNARRRKQKLLRNLRLATIILSLVVVVMAIFLVSRTLRGVDAPIAATSSSMAAVVSSIPATTTATPTPLPTPQPELLQQSANVESFFGPLPISEATKPLVHNEIRAAYIGAGAYVDNTLALAKNSEINAVVVDIKESNGVLFDSQNPLAKELGLVKSLYNLSDLVKTFHDNDIKVIGRIVCFKDPDFAAQRPEDCIKDEAGNTLYFKNEGGKAFTNPYDKDIWEYNIALAEEAIQAGVDEIQLDYVRFPTGSTTSGAKPYFGDPATTPTKVETINRFLQTARIRLQEKYGIPVGADVFGIILSSDSDGDILGQNWATVGLTGIDNLAPMVYPSHYAENTVLNGKTFPVPDQDPYGVLFNAFELGKTAASKEGYATIRPYIQAFTASWVKGYINYGYDQINEQIKAIKDAGYSEWILWNPGGKYPEGKYDGA